MTSANRILPPQPDVPNIDFESCPAQSTNSLMLPPPPRCREQPPQRPATRHQLCRGCQLSRLMEKSFDKRFFSGFVDRAWRLEVDNNRDRKRVVLRGSFV